MKASLTAITCAAALLVGLASTATAQSPTPGPPPAYRVEQPTKGALYKDGPDGRYLLGGTWLFRFDRGVGLSDHFERTRSIAGWQQVSVPNAWNATDESKASFTGTAAWYRKDFTLPTNAKGPTWILRFESVNYRSRIWLNGHEIGSHEGAYLPFEFALPGKLLKRSAINRIAIRVDNRRKTTDFPPAGLTEAGDPAGGWWNYGGLLREVYLRKVNTIDFDSVQVLPHLPCATCAARISYSVVLHNYSAKAQHVELSANYGGHAVSVGARTIRAGGVATYTRNLTVANPVLWSPAHPYLYNATLDAKLGGHRVAHYYVMSGIRSISVVAGHLMLNGRPLDFRGVGLQEDSPQYGFAINSTIRQRFIAEVKDLGATAIRAHYPLHPELEELADENGILLWSEVPVYSIKTPHLNTIRKPAVALVQRNVITNSNHPSIIVWSIANELASKTTPSQLRYIRDAVTAAHRLDPTRPVGQAVAGYPAVGCQAAYGPLDVIGLNDYFGWYIGPKGQIADGTLLPDFLDEEHACYPNKALVVTEFGAEADRHGPLEERGTYEYQQAFVNYHLGVFASKSYLSGAIYWALEEFRVRPDWKGGNPFPHPPIHEKGLISFTGDKKPAYFDVQAAYKATQQLR
ncbi:MAG: glycoside hydrolase family 2 protein [Solirubrobacteraceae bacterium]